MMDRPPLFARFVLLIVVCFISSFIAWAAVARVDEIARGDGKVIPLSKTQIIQSSEPGIVKDIAVKLGQVVKKGDLLVELDDTTTRSSLGEATARAIALRAKIARLEHEAAGDLEGDFACPAEVQKAAPEICRNETSLLKARQENLLIKMAVLQDRRAQRQSELKEAEANILRLEKNVAGAEEEWNLISPMVERGLAAQTDLLRIKRDLAEQRGQLALARESLPRIKAAIDEAEHQIGELPSQLQQEALAEKTQALAELSVVEQTIHGASDRVRRTDIRSPVDGIVNTLEVNTIGAYVEPGTVIAGVVPTSDTLLVEARISPRDVAFVRVGQPALVKVTAYDFSIFGGLNGEVANVSADSLVDQETGEIFYQVRVTTDQSELERNGERYAIIPGMVTSVEIMTGQKTVLDYMLKPINKARTEALTER